MISPWYKLALDALLPALGQIFQGAAQHAAAGEHDQAHEALATGLAIGSAVVNAAAPGIAASDTGKEAVNALAAPAVAGILSGITAAVQAGVAHLAPPGTAPAAQEAPAAQPSGNATYLGSTAQNPQPGQYADNKPAG